MSFIKTKHTAESLERAAEQARQGLGDKTPAFVPVEGVTVQANRHMGSLLRMVELLEIRNSVRSPDAAVEECTTLLERKLELLDSLGIQTVS